MDEAQKITIKDIARLTGLSKGTVDRVLHNREGVSKKSYEKVMKVIRDLGYEPNIFASLLAQHRDRVIVALLPECAGGEFWSLYDPGIEKGREFARNFGLKVEKKTYDQYDLESFRAACNEVLTMAPAGVLLTPLFKNETLGFVGKLAASGIPYAYIDYKLECNNYLAFFGMAGYQSGYLCAALLTEDRPVNEVCLVRIRRDKARLSDPTIQRRSGFEDYMAEHCPGSTVHSVFIDPNDTGSIDGILSEFFASHPGVKHVAMLNSRIYLILPFLRRHPDSGVRIVGFDNLQDNMTALRSGEISALITQHPDEQVSYAIASLTEKTVLGKDPARRDNFMHMDILTRYNVEYY